LPPTWSGHARAGRRPSDLVDGPDEHAELGVAGQQGLELIETHLLFGIPYDRIEVVVHPQSIVHSMVTFNDGSTIAQASPPDMKLPFRWRWAGHDGYPVLLLL